MAKAKDVLKRMVALMDKGHLDEATVHKVLDGMIIRIKKGDEKVYKYRNGSLVSEGRVTTLSADNIIGLG